MLIHVIGLVAIFLWVLVYLVSKDMKEENGAKATTNVYGDNKSTRGKGGINKSKLKCTKGEMR